MSLPYLHPYLGLSNGLNTLHAAGGAGGIGGWVELGRTTLGSAGDIITVSSLADKRYYMILSSEINSNVSPFMRLNNDSGSNYARRYYPSNLSTEHTQTVLDNIDINTLSGTPFKFQMGYWANYASKEKLGIIQSATPNTAGAGNAPVIIETVGKWANTSNAINRVDVINENIGDFASGSEVVVLGWDPADTHTNNFWEELASVELGSAGDTINSGTITAKKYLWFQCYTKGANTETQFRLNSDSGSNYASSRSSDGGAYSTFTSQTLSKSMQQVVVEVILLVL